MSFSFSKIILVLLGCLAMVIVVIQTLTFVYILKIQSDQKLDGRDLSGTEFAYEKNFSIIVSGYMLKQQVKELQSKNWELKNKTEDLQNEYDIIQQQVKELQNENRKLQNENRELQNISIAEFQSLHAKCAYNALRSPNFTTVLNLRLPFSHSLIENGIGKRIFIGGVVHPADWRKKWEGLMKSIVANSLINARWGTEEIISTWPVVRHISFCTEIINKKNAFEVKFDGQRLLDYSYRSSNGNISEYYLQIGGDVTLEEVSFTVP